jgi:hypothetical protein
LAKNFDIRILPTWKGTIDPHNVSSPNVQSDLPSKSGTLGFVWKPPSPKWFPFVDTKVRCINRNLAHIANVATETVCP